MTKSSLEVYWYQSVQDIFLSLFQDVTNEWSNLTFHGRVIYLGIFHVSF